MATLHVVPADLATFCHRQRAVAGQIDSALDADAPVIATMPNAYGTVGASFTAAVDGFESALTRTGAALAGAYRRMSEALEIAGASYAMTDQATGAVVSRSGVPDERLG